jgi:hypothetical protein
MEFQTQAHKNCYEKVAGIVREIFGEHVIHCEDSPIMMLMIG